MSRPKTEPGNILFLPKYNTQTEKHIYTVSTKKLYP